MPDCLNCGETLSGHFCSNCGQRATFHLALHDFVHEAFHELLHFDQKILRTLRLLLFEPGALTSEFVAGRRASSVGPIRLYLIASAFLFWIVFTFGASIGKVRVGDQTAPIGKAAAARPSDNHTAAPAAGSKDVHKVAEAFGRSLPKAMFLLMPVSALILWALYRRQQPYYIPHLYFAIHLHAFVFVVLSAMALIKASGIVLVIQASVLMLPWIGYHVIAGQRRFYAVSWGAAVARGAAGTVLYFVLFGATIYALARLALASV